MAENYSVNLKAQLDTTDVQNKLQQLGNTGGNSITQLETAINNLNGSIQQLGKSWHNVAEQQKQAANNMTKFLRGAGAAMVGQVLQTGGRYAAAAGHENIATGADYAGAALKGAGAGAAIGSMIPVVGTTVGAAVGAAVGTLNEAFEKLAKSAEDAAKKLDQIISSEHRTNKQFEDVVLAEHAAKFKDMDASQLAEQKEYWQNQQFDYINLSKQGRAPNQDQLVYEQQLATTKEEYDKASQMLQAINAVEEQRRQEKEKALQAAQREAEAEQRKADAAQKQAEAEEKLLTAQRQAISKSAAAALGSFQQQQRLQSFREGLQDLTPAELQNMKDNLIEQNSALAGKVTDLFSYAETTGAAADYEAAQNALSEYNEGSVMQRMVEGVLGGISGIGEGEGGLSSTFQSMQALSTEAQKGYDVGGYGKLDEQMLKAEQETKDATKESASSLRSINTKLDEVKNAITSGNIGGKWG